MRETDGAPLSFATDRLAHALMEPIRFGQAEWGERTLRALASLRQALQRHAALTEEPQGVLGRHADRSLLPFTEACRRAARVREQQASLRNATAMLEQELAAVVGFSDSLASLTAPDRALDDQARSDTFRALLAVARQGERLLEAIRDYRTAEEEFRATSDEAGQSGEPASASHRSSWPARAGRAS